MYIYFYRRPYEKQLPSDSGLRRDVNELKLISDDKIYDEMYAASSLTRRAGTKVLFEDYRTFKIHPIG